MGDIYANSSVTIAAANSSTSNSGILNSRAVPDKCSLPWNVPVAEGSFKTYEVHARGIEHWWSLLHRRSLPLETRGWCLQEELFPSRRLVFAPQQAGWQCRAHGLLEGGADKQSTLVADYFEDDLALRSLPNTVPDFPLEIWYNMITRFSRRNLTRETDRLSAIASLADHIQKATNLTYAAGLWEEDFAYGLCWKFTIDTQVSLVNVRIKELSSSPFLGPSWSWCSSNGRPVDQSEGWAKSRANFIWSARIFDIQTKALVASNPFGSVTGGSFKISAPCYSFHPSKLQLSPFEEEVVHQCRLSCRIDIAHLAMEIHVLLLIKTSENFVLLLLVPAAEQPNATDAVENTICYMLGSFAAYRIGRNSPLYENSIQAWHERVVTVV